MSTRNTRKGPGADKNKGRKPSFKKPNRNTKPSFSKEEKPFKKNDGATRSRFKKEEKPFKKYHKDQKPVFSKDDRPTKRFDKDEKPRFSKDDRPAKRFDKDEKPRFSKDDRPAKRDNKNEKPRFSKDDRPAKRYDKDAKPKRNFTKGSRSSFSEQKEAFNDGRVRLNKYISNAGICSRREADELIQAGAVSVNGKIVTEMGYRVNPGDTVNYGGQTLRKEKLVYILLNKPKDYITSMDDPGGRKTVLELVNKASKERVYPVGRLDRTTTGLLILTNDGELTKRLTHPKYGIKKIYQVSLDKALYKEDFDKISNGLQLEDGAIKVDAISYVGEGKKEIGIEIHSGKNRIVRRIFEHLGYQVKKLDRVFFAGLTKKNLPRGRWRLLSEQEIALLKMTKG